jgi:hypothetical protein
MRGWMRMVGMKVGMMVGMMVGMKILVKVVLEEIRGGGGGRFI